MSRKLSLIIGLMAVLGASPVYATIYISGDPESGISVSGSHVTITKSGSYRLTDNSIGDITVGSSSNHSIEVTLDLNGYILSNNSVANYPNIVRNYAKLTLIDSSEGHTGTIDGKGGYLGSSGRGIKNEASSVLYFKSGTIQDCHSTVAGGGISVMKGATAYLQGGTIQNCRVDSSQGGGNTSTLGGGGVFNAGTFYFQSGTIKDCVAKSHAGCGSKHLGGGGIYNHGGDDGHAGMLYMSGGTIESCTVSRSADFSGISSRAHGGGGVLNVGTGAETLPTDRGVFVMTGGTIKKCHVNMFLRGCGGGVFNAEGTFYMQGGMIGGESDDDGNYVTRDGSSYGGGICSRGEYFTNRTSDSPKSQETNAYFEMTGGTVAYNRSPGYAGGGICMNYGSAVITGGLITHNTAGAIGGGFIGGNATSVTFGGTAVVSYNKVTDARSYTDKDCGGGGIAVGKASGNNVFTMTGGTVIYNTCDGNGGGLYLRNVASSGQTNDVRIEGGLIAYNESGTAHDETYAAGGGVFTNGNVTITGGEISNNNCYTNGGGLFMGADSKRLEMSGGLVKDNTARYDGGGIYITGGAGLEKVEFKGGEFNNNTSNKNGGGFYLAKGDVTVNSNNNEFKVINNHALNTNNEGYGGGLYVNNGSLSIKSTLNDILVDGNDAYIDGGGFYVSGGNVTMSGGNITNNEVTSGNGGAFFVKGGDVTINGGSVSGNSSVSGGGVYVDGGNFSFSNGTISDNTAASNGGGAYVSSGIVTFKGNISDNSALNGGGLYLGPGASMEFQGGLIINNQADTTLTTSVIRAKTAYHGGADVPGWGSSVIEGCGGGIYLQSGKSSSKKTTLTFNLDPNDKTFGLYTNRAQKGGDDIVSEGLNTEVVLPSVREMQLYGFEGKDATPFWYQDYFYEDSGYNLTNGHAVEETVRHIDRFREIIKKYTNDYLDHRIPDDVTNLSRIKNYYLCLTLSYNMLDITISAKHLLGHETALFQLVRHGGTEDYKYDVILRGDMRDSKGKSSRTLRNMPWGTYSIFPNDAWNWAYDKIAPQMNLRLGETGNYEFVFEMNHINNAEVPQHDERQPERSGE